MDPTRRHVDALDGLRGLAVLAVVLFHAGHLTGGYLGVDVFFVLSGFLITSLLLREAGGTGRVALGRFWARRARRLLPALGLLLVGVAVWARIAESGTLPGLRGDALATSAYFANWHAIAGGQDYWALFRSPSPLEHTWSLAIEEQFYLVWPLVIAVVAHLRRRAIAPTVRIVALVGALVSYALMQVLVAPGDTARVYYGTDTRAASVLLGAAFAATVIGIPAVRPRAERAWGVTGFVGIAVLVAAALRLPGDDLLLYRAGFLVSALATVGVIASVTLAPKGALARALGWRPLVGLGLISYGVYLWHWPVDVVLDADRTGLSGWTLFALQFAVTTGIAVISYVFVERPIRHGWGSKTFWLVATPAAAVVVVGVIVGATALQGAPTAATTGGLDPTIGTKMTTRENLELEKLAVDRMFPASVPRVVVVGDSMGFSLAQGANQDRTTPYAVAGAAMLGCGLTAGEPLETRTLAPERVCSRWPEAWRRAIDVFRPRALVLLTGVWDIWPRRVDGHREELYSPRLTKRLDDALGRGAAIAREAGVPLVVLTVPCLDPSAHEVALTGDGLADRRRMQWFNRRLRAFARRESGVHLVDLGARVCRTGELGPDGVHFSLPAAATAWRWLTPRVTPLLR